MCHKVLYVTGQWDRVAVSLSECNIWQQSLSIFIINFRPCSNSNYGFHLAGPWGLFLKAARQILPLLVERPRGFE